MCNWEVLCSQFSKSVGEISRARVSVRGICCCFGSYEFEGERDFSACVLLALLR